MSAMSSIQICRVMHPDDANHMGNIHGGTILKMIEEAGRLISTRHCNTPPGEQCMAMLARVERTDFLYPIFIGEVAHVSAAITYTSKHSLEVVVNIMSENIISGDKKLTNKATLWYVPCSIKNLDQIIEVPPIKYATLEEEERGRKRYESQKMERMQTKEKNGDMIIPGPDPELYTVAFSQSCLIHAVMPPDCSERGFMRGGMALKLMDETAGVVATRHCKTCVATASVDAVNFHHKVNKGHVVFVTGRMTFTSNKSMEIEVVMDADDLVTKEKVRVATAFFTYTSVDMEKSKSLPIPPMKVETAEEQKRFEEGKMRYLQNKAKRLAEREGQQ